MRQENALNLQIKEKQIIKKLTQVTFCYSIIGRLYISIYKVLSQVKLCTFWFQISREQMNYYKLLHRKTTVA